LKEEGHSLRIIAKTLGRTVSTISYELKHNTVAGAYTPAKAQHKATVRRKAAKYQGMKIIKEPELHAFIDRELLNQQSPAAIAGRLATGLDGLPYASRDTIETYIRSVYGRRIEYELAVLKRQRTRSRKRAPQVAELGQRTYIDNRPAVITNRERVGDLEADFILSGKSGTGILLTAADRKIRVGFIRKILPVTIANVEAALLDIKRVFPELTSITIDNDLLFRYHKRLEQLLGVPVYFCHAYHSWEKGTIENYNKQVRKYVKKGSDISQYSKAYLRFVESRLNRRFMSVLNYQTPEECLHEHRRTTGKPGN